MLLTLDWVFRTENGIFFIYRSRQLLHLLGVKKPTVKRKEWRTERREQPKVSLFKCELTSGVCHNKMEAVFEGQHYENNKSDRRLLYSRKQSKTAGRLYMNYLPKICQYQGWWITSYISSLCYHDNKPPFY